METKKMISFEGTGYLKEALRIEAFKKETTVSALIRQILESQLQPTLEECRKKEARQGETEWKI
jgi:hypothetical protein